MNYYRSLVFDRDEVAQLLPVFEDQMQIVSPQMSLPRLIDDIMLRCFLISLRHQLIIILNLLKHFCQRRTRGERFL